MREWCAVVAGEALALMAKLLGNEIVDSDVLYSVRYVEDRIRVEV